MRFRNAVCLFAALALFGAACSSGDDTSSGGDEPAEGSEFSGSYEATITRTQGGVPHIVGDTIESVVFGQGFANGEDHLCTLSDQILKVKSQRAEFYGPGEDDENVASDFAWKAIGIDALARKDWVDQPPEVTNIIEAYAAGWNTYLEETGADAVSGWCAGESWVQPITAEDLYSYARSISLTASSVQLARFMGSAQPPETDEPPTAEVDISQVDFNVAGPDATVASNGWALGSERTESGGGMLLANPHFPWEGALRFWEVHLEVPGELDIYGAMLIGLPAVGIGFNDSIAWTHTVSAGNRFTAYKLELDPEDPTAYMFDGESVPMTQEEATISVLGDDGETTEETRTLWSSQHGPILDFPGVGWDDSQTVAVRDANLNNDEFVGQYFDMNTATSMDEFKKAHEEHQGIPLFNTVATSADGETWYADTSATPNLSDEAIEAYAEALDEGGLTSLAADSGAVLLDGSTSRDEWVEVEGARDPGLVPYSEMPQQSRTDYVFNANDSFWLSNVENPLAGDYSPMHGAQETERSVRTRENATILTGTGARSLAGDDDKFTLDELTAAAFNNVAHSARALRPALVERCNGVGVIDIGALVDPEDESVLLPADAVNITEACNLLAAWDGRFDLDSVGAIIWREWWNEIDRDTVWATEFNVDDPVNTPAGLAPAEPDNPDPALDALARAVQIIVKAGFAIDAPLGDLQKDGRGDGISLQGGYGSEGITNALGYSSGGWAPNEDVPERPDRTVPSSSLTSEGYWINNGTSFIMGVDFTPDGPVARSILTYGETGDRTDPLFSEQTKMFANKEWKDVLRSPEDIEAGAISDPYTVSG